MEYRTLGRTGVRVSPLCLGTLNLGDPTPETIATQIIHKALEAGINFIDTADMYVSGESERIVGKALSDGRRGKVILATKFHFPTSLAGTPITVMPSGTSLVTTAPMPTMTLFPTVTLSRITA